MGWATEERALLCALLAETGPGAPTLCEGWRTLDLAAHLVLRERHPAAAAGVLGGPLKTHTALTQRKLAATPYQELLAKLAAGPPRLSLFGVPGMDERLNLSEFFVHHEDVRRAAGGWEPRPLTAARADILWRRLRGARMLFRKVPVGVELVRGDSPPDSTADGVAGRVRLTVRARVPMVTVTGDPGELTLWVMGRVTAARVTLDGAPGDVAMLARGGWGV